VDEYALGIAAALGLGLQTAISPCPLTMNIAAISYIGRRVASPRQVFLAGLLYTLGQTLVYVALATALATGLLRAPRLSIFLQRYMDELLGPILIIVAAFLLELIRVNVRGMGVSDTMQQRVDRLGIWGAGLLGIVFALAFCPVSAAYFFGGLIPLCLKLDSPAMLPCAYGIGMALPVVLFAGLIALGARSVGKAFNALAKIEWWARRLTGVLFLLVGIWYSLRFIFEAF
jgi:cytochrome c biogenesis protein CcdA